MNPATANTTTAMVQSIRTNIGNVLVRQLPDDSSDLSCAATASRFGRGGACIGARNIALSCAMQSPRRTRLTDADRALWASFASRIRPLAEREPIEPGPEPAVAPTQLRPLADVRTVRVPLTLLAIGVQPGGVDSASWHRLRGGKLRAERVLDLHGHTAQRAFHALVAFLRAASADGTRCVEVVTGQGGVLRRELPLWLNLGELRGLVLAAAHPHAANPGSVRLLLRRAR
jgi:DNA-nicking Smr family endonuclease